MFKYAQTCISHADCELLKWTVISLQHDAYLQQSSGTHCADPSAVHIMYFIMYVCVKGVMQEVSHNLAPPPILLPCVPCWKVHSPIAILCGGSLKNSITPTPCVCQVPHPLPLWHHPAVGISKEKRSNFLQYTRNEKMLSTNYILKLSIKNCICKDNSYVNLDLVKMANAHLNSPTIWQH